MIKEEILVHVDSATAHCERAATMISRSQGDASTIHKLLYNSKLEIDIALDKLKENQEEINFGYKELHPDF